MIFTFVFLALALAFFTIGMGLDDRRAVKLSLAIEAPHERVYSLVSDLKAGWPLWNPLMRQGAGVVLDHGPQASGEGVTIRWTAKAGTGSLELTACTPGVAISYRTTMSFGRMSAVGTLELSREPTATIVTWREELSVGSNPIWKWLARAMDGVRQRNLTRGLAALKHVAEQGTPLPIVPKGDQPFPSGIIAGVIAIPTAVACVVGGYREMHAGRGCDGGTCAVAFLMGLAMGAAVLMIGFPSLWLLIAGARRVVRRVRRSSRDAER